MLASIRVIAVRHARRTIDNAIFDSASDSLEEAVEKRHNNR